jgi:hypothetical protein
MKKKYKKYLPRSRVSLGGPIASIRSEPIVLPSSRKLTMIVPGHCHYLWVVETNQVIQHLVD